MSETPAVYRVENVIHVRFGHPCLTIAPPEEYSIEEALGQPDKEVLLDGRLFLEIRRRMRGKSDRRERAAAAARKIHRLERDADVLYAYGLIQ